MGAIGIREILFLLVVLALIFGAKRLPELAKGLGSGIRNFKGSVRGGSERNLDNLPDLEDP